MGLMGQNDDLVSVKVLFFLWIFLKKLKILLAIKNKI
jgi:hypothetical protein